MGFVCKTSARNRTPSNTNTNTLAVPVTVSPNISTHRVQTIQARDCAPREQTDHITLRTKSATNQQDEYSLRHRGAWVPKLKYNSKFDSHSGSKLGSGGATAEPNSEPDAFTAVTKKGQINEWQGCLASR